MALLNQWRPWLAAQGFLGELTLNPVPGGMNNRGYELRSDTRRAFLKHYSSHSRLETEYGFLSLLKGNRAPRPLASNPELCLGLYEFLEGEKVRPPIPLEAVEQARSFLDSLQELRGGDLPPASDACITLRGHWEAVGRRVQQIEAHLPQAWQEEWKSRWRTRLPWLESLPREPEVEQGELIVSPSDFGFHNALRLPDGSYRFLDMEYAGVDEPSKVVCDFFSQPRLPAPLEGLPRFLDLLDARATSRLSWMWPVTVFKWACIILKQVLPKESFSTEPVEFERQRAKLEWLIRRDQEVRELLDLERSS